MNASSNYDEMQSWEEVSPNVRVVCQDECSITYVNHRTDDIWTEYHGAATVIAPFASAPARSVHIGK